MEANRLVFVFLRDSKPRRKVAVPVPDNYTWDLFINQVGPFTTTSMPFDTTFRHHMHYTITDLPYASIKVKLKLKLTGVGDIFLASVRPSSSWRMLHPQLEA